MAASRLPEPGTKFGPCPEPCKHKDCAETRTLSDWSCHYCGLPIGYGVRFYHESDKTSQYVHAHCLEDQIEARG